MMTKTQTLNARWLRWTDHNWVPPWFRHWLQKHPKFAMAALALLIAFAVIVVVRWFSPNPAKELSYYTVKRGDFLVSVVEGGSLRALNEVVIRCEVEGSTRIISIAPEGSQVKKGELLVELDSSDIQEKLTQQEITAENLKFNYLQGQENLEIQKSLAESNIREAELRVQIAASDLEKYVEGDFPQQTNKLSADITIAEEELKRAQDRYSWTLKLQERNYASKSEVEADELALKRANIKIEQLKEDLRLLLKYDFPKRKALLESTLASNKDDLARLKARSASQISQAQADLETRKRALDLHTQRLQSLREQLSLTKIYAPQDGLVVYPSFSTSSGYVIEEGSTVRQRQELIKLPDVTQMLVEVKVHESFVNSIRPGLLAYVTVDSMPDRRFVGSVRRVAPLPDATSRYMNPNLKVYSTEVVIEEVLPDVKPGVSAHAEIVITNLSKVITLPVQAVTTLKGRQVIYRADANEPVEVELGLSNNRFVEVRSGVKEGDQVLLAPPAATSVEDAGNGQLSAEEVESAKARIAKNPLDTSGKGSISRSGAGASKLPPAAKPERTEKPAKPTSKPAKPTKS
jgi:HlyD family secretion protein